MGHSSGSHSRANQGYENVKGAKIQLGVVFLLFSFYIVGGGGAVSRLSCHPERWHITLVGFLRNQSKQISLQHCSCSVHISSGFRGMGNVTIKILLSPGTRLTEQALTCSWWMRSSVLPSWRPRVIAPGQNTQIIHQIALRKFCIFNT